MEELIDMNLRQKIFGFSAWAVVMLSLPCNSFALEDKAAAKIGDEKIMQSDIMRIVSYQDPDKQRLMEQNPQFKVSLLTRIVIGRVISAIAREKGFDKKTFIKDQLEILVNEFLTAEYIKREVIEKIEVTEEDMKLYYKTREAEFKIPETARASQILIRVDKSSTTEEKAKAREKIADVLKRIKAGEEFSKLASEISEDTDTKTRGGDMGLIQKGRVTPELDRVIFSLRAGEVSDMVETKLGFHLIKVDERNEPLLEPFEKVRDKVREKVLAEFKKSRKEEFVQKAMKDAGAEIYPEVFLEKK